MFLNDNQANSFNLLRSQLGDPVWPSLQECKEKFDALSADDSFFWVFNLKENRVTFHKGIYECLGYPFETASLTGLTKFIPEAYKDLHFAQVVAAYQALSYYEKIEDLKEGLIRYCTNIICLDANGNEVHAYQTSYPFQFDENNRVVSNISWYHIKQDARNSSAFQGGRFIVDRNLKDSMSEDLEALNSLLVKSKIQLIDNYPFTEMEQKLIRVLYKYLHRNDIKEKEKNQEIAKALNRSHRTIQKHRDNIMRKGKEFFGINFLNHDALIEKLDIEGFVFV